MISLFALTWERAELSISTMQTNIANAKNFAPMELLVCDQGSKDRRAVDWVKANPLTTYLRENKRNEGVGKSFNQLYLRSKGEYLCFMGSDLALPPGWLAEMLGYAKGVPNSGIIGMDWGHGGIPPLTFKNGSHAHWITPALDRVFGVWMMRREVVESVGLFCEEFQEYGLEDSNFNNRVNKAGFLSCYVPNTHFKCKHVGVGDQDTGEYRAMKDKSLQKNLEIFSRLEREYQAGRPLKEALPEMREPLT